MENPAPTELLQKQATENPYQLAEQYREIIFSFMFEPGEHLYSIAREAHTFYLTFKYLPGLALTTSIQGQEFLLKGQYDKARNLLEEGIRFFEESGEVMGYALALSMMALTNNNTGNYSEALRYALLAHKIAEKSQHQKELGLVRYTLGTIYIDTQEYALALATFHEVLKLWHGNTNLMGQGRVHNAMGIAHQQLGNLEAALHSQQQALGIFVKENVPRGLGRTYNDLGNIYTQMGNYDLAEKYLLQSLEIRDKDKLPDPLISTLINLGKLYILKRVFAEALKYLNQGVEIALSLGAQAKLAKLYQCMATAYQQQGDFQKGLLYFEQFHELHEKLFRSEMHDKVKNLEMQVEKEREQREYELTRMRNVELAQLNDDLQHALSTIKDSIDYARRIQEALLPSQDLRARLLPNSFVFYRPRDVVSGDFYWMAEIGEKKLLAVVDCTGHGVPGAFMSLLGISLLNEIVLHGGDTCPSSVLGRINTRLQQVLGSSEVLDGMEAGVVCWNDKELLYAGAGIPMYQCAQGTLQEHAARPYGLGGRQDTKQGYPDTQIQLKHGDTFYLFSDGFKDQFGWHRERREKFSRSRFRQMISEAGNLSIPEQGEYVSNTFIQWQGQHKQIDDVLLVGFRL